MTELFVTGGGVLALALVALVVLCGRSPRGAERLERLITVWRRGR